MHSLSRCKICQTAMQSNADGTAWPATVLIQSMTPCVIHLCRVTALTICGTHCNG